MPLFMKNVVWKLLFLSMFALWCVAVYEPDSPEMDRVGLALHKEFLIGASTQSEVEGFLVDSEWPISYRLTDEKCREKYGDSDFVCPGGDQIFATVPVASGMCGWFGRKSVRASFGFNSIATLVSIGTEMGPSWHVKLC